MGPLLVAACSQAPQPTPTATEDRAIETPAEAPAERIYRVATVEAGVETLQAADGHTLSFDTAARRLDGQHARVRWPSWGEVLQVCLGDPLDLPPGGDTGAFRKLAWDGSKGRWALELSGMNRCSMSGRVHLSVKQDRVFADALLVDGIAWGEGGQFRAKELLRAELRDVAVKSWPELPPEEQLRTWRSLKADPEGGEVLEEIERLYGPFDP